MEHRVLGRTGVRVSSLAFGTMSFGREADRETAHGLYQRCREAGVNMFDWPARCSRVVSGAHYGAFGTGVLDGWRKVSTSTMAMPEFDLVTGVRRDRKDKGTLGRAARAWGRPEWLTGG